MWYTLDKDNKPILSTIIQYVEWIEKNPERKAVKQEYVGDVRISTVFLGLDHAAEKAPVLWETMIFGGEHDQYMDRYTSYEDAVKGHQTVLNLIINKNET